MVLAPSVAGLFKWRQFEPEMILLAVGWYLRFSLSYRDVEELLAERGLLVDQSEWLRDCKPWSTRAFLHVQDCLWIANWIDFGSQLPLPISYCHLGQAAIIDGGFTLDLGEAHGLGPGYIRGLNRVIAQPVELQTLD